MSTATALTRPEMLDAMSAALPPIKCSGCTACCKQDRIILTREDDPKAYRWHLEDGVPMLDRTPDGACVYLTKAGCGIHGKAPSICRRFDCRVLFQATPLKQRAVRVRQNQQMIHIYAAGHQRLKAMEA